MRKMKNTMTENIKVSDPYAEILETSFEHENFRFHETDTLFIKILLKSWKITKTGTYFLFLFDTLLKMG